MKSILFRQMDFKERTYLKSGEKPPKGVQVKTGARGGKYFEEPGAIKPEVELHDEKKVKNTVKELNAQIPNKIYKKIQNVKSEVKKGNTTKNKFSAGGFYSGSRRKLHNEIIDKFIKNVSSVETPKAVLVAGIPGSGKTSALTTLYDVKDFVCINSDDIKEYLPEYQENPINAPLIHDESTDIELRLIRKCIKNKMPIMIDKTFRNMKKAKIILKAAKRKGYNTEMVATQLPTHKSIQRAHNRMLQTGRYVPYEFIMASAPAINHNIHEMKKKMKTKIYNTDIPMGKKPIRIERANTKEWDNELLEIWNKMDDTEDDAIIKGLQ